jgi:hypothetical protein
MVRRSTSYFGPLAATTRAAALLLASALCATASCAAAQETAEDLTPSQSALVDRFVGAWQQPPGSFVYAPNGGGPAKGPVLPPGLENEHPYGELEKISAEHLQPWARAKQQATEWDVDDTGAVCKRDGIFRQGLASGFSMSLVRAHGKLVWLGDVEEIGPRDLWLGARHPQDVVPTWNGDSRIHIEGETLVIDTVSFNDKSWLGSDRQPHTEALHVIEYLTLHDNDQWLENRVIVDDRKALTGPYTFSRAYKRQSLTSQPTKATGPVAPGVPGSAEEICNQSRIGHDPWRRKREEILQDHQQQLDTYIKQVMQK